MSKAAQNRLEGGASEPSYRWRGLLVLAFGVVIGALALHYQTAWSMVSIWMRSDTFAHGFIILPITLWLVWERRRTLINLIPKPEYRALLPLAGAGFLWLFANVLDVLVVQQLALIMMLITALWVVVGNQLCWAILFPLLFLFFAVPMGEELVPHLMEFTADFTVGLLRLTGVPVYREGLFFSLPSGEWSVVEACSGIRYLIASITLGSLFAYLTYSSYTKRLIFIVASCIVPILANGVRAYIIVMLGHLSDMTLAVGVDHLVYGWVFFGIIMLILFSIGAIWRDKEMHTPEGTAQVDAAALAQSHQPIIFWRAGGITLSIVALWPLIAFGLNQYSSSTAHMPIVAPPGAAGWQTVDQEFWGWTPQIVGADSSAHRFYRKGDRVVKLSLWQFVSQQQGAELVSSQHMMIRDDDKLWRRVGVEKRPAVLPGGEGEVEQSLLKGYESQLLAWRWYRVGDQYTLSDYSTKLLEAKAILTLGRRDGAILIVAAPFAEQPAEASATLQSFLDEMLPNIEQALDAAQ